MAESKTRKIVSKVLKTVGIVVLAFLLSFVMVQPFSISTATLLSSNDHTDYSITDFYQVVANSRAVRQLDPDIVIVDIADADRASIAETLDLISLCEPRAVGLDVVFAHPQEDDEPLINAMQHLPGVVMAVAIDPQERDGCYQISEETFFADSLTHATEGAVNLPVKYAKGTIRKFPVLFPLADGDTLKSFSAAVAESASPEAMRALRNRKSLTEIINYPSREFRVVRYDEVADRGEELSGRVVMVGAMNDEEDRHVTPVSGNMSGIEVHSHAVATILHGDYLQQLTTTQNWVIAVSLCFLFVLLSVVIHVGVKGLLLRVLQVVMLYLIVRLGYFMFVEHNVIIDFSYSFLMVTFGLFATDVWIGFTTIGKWCYKKLNNNKVINMLVKKFGKIMTMLLMACMTVLNASAEYSVHNVSGNVRVNRTGRPEVAKKGMSVRASDQFEIANGGRVEIYNSLTSEVYSSTGSGKFTVTKIMLDAKRKSQDNRRMVNDKISMRPGTVSEGSNAYLERGFVTRALVTYDPAGMDIQVDPKELARKVMTRLKERNDTASVCPVDLQHEVINEDGLRFEVNNENPYPVYFNIIKVCNRSDEPETRDGVQSGENQGEQDKAPKRRRRVVISDLGQPVGSYIVLPGQSMMRSQKEGMIGDGRHVMIMTHYYFDIDELIEYFNTVTLEDAPIASDEQLPVFVRVL